MLVGWGKVLSTTTTNQRKAKTYTHYRRLARKAVYTNQDTMISSEQKKGRVVLVKIRIGDNIVGNEYATISPVAVLF
jgi:hypothetical protein